MPTVPTSLAPYVVAQDYSQYDAADQATWRFVLLHLSEHLSQRAHPAYRRGLGAAGMGLDRIPTISEMDAALEKYGWGAACVTGFIPPRAFQAFQAAGILPIAAEIRSPEHLAYTPAPDIIHEAAGHAPLLIDAEYAAYLREIGDLGRFAFSSLEDQEVYRAILHLSKVKEDPAASRETLERASVNLTHAYAAQRSLSEASRLARLYWWTAEYGLVGTPDDYQIYGAGLLSSLGESHSCERPQVRKLPLDASCMNTNYDITQPQPQLFVARSFGHLRDVLGDARAELSSLRSVFDARASAIASRLPCTAEFAEGLDLVGTLCEPHQALFRRPLEFQAGAFPRLPRRATWKGTSLPCLAERVQLPAASGYLMSQGSKMNWNELEIPSSLDLEFDDGQSLRGQFSGVVLDAGGRPLLAHLRDVRILAGGSPHSYAHYPLPLTELLRILPGEDDVGAAGVGVKMAPLPRSFSAAQARLRGLYAAANDAWQGRTGSTPLPVFGAILEHLRDFPDDWLLRWNLLESLLKLGACDDTHSLFLELERLEVAHREQQPIATGLRSLRRIVGHLGPGEER